MRREAKKKTPLTGCVMCCESPVCYSDLEAVINSTSGTEPDRPQSLITRCEICFLHGYTHTHTQKLWAKGITQKDIRLHRYKQTQ